MNVKLIESVINAVHAKSVLIANLMYSNLHIPSERVQTSWHSSTHLATLVQHQYSTAFPGHLLTPLVDITALTLAIKSHDDNVSDIIAKMYLTI